MKLTQNKESSEANINETVKFYYTMLREHQSWLMSKESKKLNKMTALLSFNTVILLVMIITLLYNQ